jgi:glyoxylase-like metal-dependent hydrolase (beta-lactamase superfamily II)
LAERWCPDIIAPRSVLVSDHTVTIGDVRITSVSDGRVVLSTSEFFPSVPDEAWLPYRDQLSPEGKLAMNLGSFLLRTNGKTVLVDTGLGVSSRGFQEVVWGLLLKDMEAKGISRDDIDMVVITHLHGDHVGWNIEWDGDSYRPTFPNARYWVPKADWDVYTRRGGMFSHMKEQVIPLETLGLLELIEGEQTLTSELTALPTPGHTPGHTSILIASQGERAVILGDVAHLPAQAQETDWSPRPDVDPEKSSTTRRDLMDRMERDGSLVIGGHFPAPGYGRLVRLRGRRYWQAL